MASSVGEVRTRNSAHTQVEEQERIQFRAAEELPMLDLSLEHPSQDSFSTLYCSDKTNISID